MEIAQQVLNQAASRRAEQILGYLRGWLGESLLDVGCGDASITHHLAQHTGMRVAGVDVLDNCRYDVPFRTFDGRRLPYADGEFDAVLVAFVLHHADDQEALLAECCRVARRRVLVLEDVYSNAFGLWVLKAVDYLGNAWVHRVLRALGTGRWEEMNIPFSFRTDPGWRRLFAERGLRLLHTQEAILDRIDPVRHQLYVLDVSPHDLPNRPPSREPEVEADRAAIEALHARDLEAARSGDTAGLIELWDEDGAILPPDGDPVIGLDSIRAALAAGARQRRFVEITHYVVDVADVTLAGDVAYEWGRYEGRSRPRAGGDETVVRGKLMRVLRRQADGSWRITRSLWTRDPD